MRAAASLAVPQNTGNASAGMKRASASTHRFGASAASALAPAKTSRMATNRRLRSTRQRGRERRAGQHDREGEQRDQLPGLRDRHAEIARQRRDQADDQNSVETMTKAARARMMMAGPEAVAGVAGKSGVAWGRWVACIQP